MKRMIKIIAVLICIVLILPCISAAAAEIPRLNKQEYQLLDTLGIIKDAGEGNAHAVSRGEMLAMAMRLSPLMRTPGAAEEQVFSDVPLQSPYTPYISAAYKSGIVSGRGDGTFGMDLPVTLQDALVMAEKVLGYGEAAGALGGYPAGFTQLAVQLDFLNGVSGTGGATLYFYDAVKLLYNILHSPAPEFVGTAQLIFSSEKTILNVNFGVYQTKAVISGTPYANIYSGAPMPAGVVTADNIQYCTDADMLAFLGQRATLYYQIDTDGERTIILADTAGNVCREVGVLQIESFNDKRMKYYDEYDKSQIVGFENDAVFLENDSIIEPGKNYVLPAHGSVTVIDNDGDGRGEVIWIRRADSFVVTGFSSDKMKLYGREKVIDLEAYDRFLVIDRDGRQITSADIEKDDIVSVYDSGKGGSLMIQKDGIFAVMTVTSAAKRDTYSGRTITFVSAADHTAFAVSDELLARSSINVGYTYIFAVDRFGTLIEIMGR